MVKKNKKSLRPKSGRNQISASKAQMVTKQATIWEFDLYEFAHQSFTNKQTDDPRIADLLEKISADSFDAFFEDWNNLTAADRLGIYKLYWNAG